MTQRCDCINTLAPSKRPRESRRVLPWSVAVLKAVDQITADPRPSGAFIPLSRTENPARQLIWKVERYPRLIEALAIN